MVVLQRLRDQVPFPAPLSVTTPETSYLQDSFEPSYEASISASLHTHAQTHTCTHELLTQKTKHTHQRCQIFLHTSANPKDVDDYQQTNTITSFTFDIILDKAIEIFFWFVFTFVETVRLLQLVGFSGQHSLDAPVELWLWNCRGAVS